MSHGHPYPHSVSRDSSSAKSWGTASSSPYDARPAQIASPSSWGTAYTKSPLSATTNFSAGPQGSVSSGSSWGSQSTHIAPPYTSPPPPYPGSPLSSPLSINQVPVGGQAPPHFGYAPAPSPYVNLNPALQDRRHKIDLRPTIYPYLDLDPSIGSAPAFMPNMTYMNIIFEGFPMWSLEVLNPHGLSVKYVLDQIYQHLQHPDDQDYQAHSGSTNHRDMLYHRDHNSSSATHCAKKTRLEVLGRTRFDGLLPYPGGNNCWMIRIC